MLKAKTSYAPVVPHETLYPSRPQGWLKTLREKRLQTLLDFRKSRSKSRKSKSRKPKQTLNEKFMKLMSPEQQKAWIKMRSQNGS